MNARELVRHRRRQADLAELRAHVGPGVAHVVHADFPDREPGEDLQAWRERIAADYLERRLATLAHHYGEEA